MSEKSTPTETPAVKPEAGSRPARGLGRGLSALLGDAAEAPRNPEDRSAPGTRDIALDLIDRNPQQPRRTFPESELLDLVNSIKIHGVLQPILLRPAEDDPARYQIVAGERRWRAAMRAGLHAIPAHVRNFDDLGTLEVGIVENVQRSDLNPVEEALAYQQLTERFGRTQQAIADTVGRSRAHVANMMRLLVLPDEVQQLLRDGAISTGHARALIGHTDAVALGQLIAKKGLSVREAERMAQAKSKSDDRVSRETLADADSRALAADLSSALGLDVAIQTKAGTSGKLLIAYRSLEQLDDLCRKLTTALR